MNDTRVTTPFLPNSCTLHSLPLFVRRVVFARAPGATEQLLTADCISLVRTVGTLGLSVAAPASGDALSVLAGEVRGGARLLRCGDRRKGNAVVTSWPSATQFFSRDLKGRWVTLDNEHLNVLQWGGGVIRTNDRCEDIHISCLQMQHADVCCEHNRYRIDAVLKLTLTYKQTNVD